MILAARAAAPPSVATQHAAVGAICAKFNKAQVVYAA